ncbi:MAG: hypothetical protein GTO02_10825 [Candidatus Dadabacteria bacterium]|nr:hypothetical protein [Candidatus Dadabacteria bacterium]NIQ14858.1 hypothetical protein [Candidatus Dadabacteria bacterium]
MYKIFFYLLFSIFLLNTQAFSGSWDLRGDISTELRYFPEDPKFRGQDNYSFAPSIKIEPELIYEFNNRNDRLTFTPFLRLDLKDENRTHFDIRELNWLHIGSSWTLLIGVDEVFWGVTESRHLVNIINQTDNVEDIDEEDKLGQPMINFLYESNYGSFDIYLLPYFRERTFPDDDARLRGPLPIDEEAKYESDLNEFHPDFAFRWSNIVGDFDIGLSFFYGTSREPRFKAKTNGKGLPELIPFYNIINQTGLDLQWTKDAWLLKFEAIGRGGQGDYFVATVSGFEYTIFQILKTNADLGLLAEYLYDGRDKNEAPITTFDNDLFTGFRLAFNDTQDTEILGGIITDTDKGELFTLLEAARRVGQSWKVEIEARLFFNTDDDSPANAFSNDGFVSLNIGRFF